MSAQSDCGEKRRPRLSRPIGATRTDIDHWGSTLSFAFLPLYTGDYRRDTQHLSPLRHGVYLLLLFHCWDTRGPLPLDEQEIAGIANCRLADEITAMRYIVGRFFTQMDDGHYNKRMQHEIERAASISTKREDAGRRGANARMQRFREAEANAKHLLGKSLASDATPTTTLTSTTTPTITATPKVPKSAPLVPTRGTRLPENWRVPDEWAAWAKRIRPDWSSQGIVRESLRFRDHWLSKAGKDAVKVNWEATWRNWIRRADAEPVR